MGLVGIRSFLFANPRVGQWQTTAAGKGHGIYGHLPGVRPNLQGDWTDELGKTRKMGSEIPWNRRILMDIGYHYCLCNHPKSIFYVSKDDFMYIYYIYIFLFMVFMDITGAFCGVFFCFFRRGFNLKSCQVILEIYPTGVIGMILWASGIYHTWDDSTQLPIFILKKSLFWIYCYAPFYCNEPSPNHGFLKLGISIQSERHAFGNRFNHPGFLESGYSSTKR